MDFSKNIIYIKIEHVSQFKTLIDVLSNILTDSTVVFTSSNPVNLKESGGLEIREADPTRTTFIGLKLHANEFAEYYIKPKEHRIGINLDSLNKLIKSIDKNSTITLSIKESDKHNLLIEVKTHDKKKKTSHKLKLLNMEVFRKPSTLEFTTRIVMPSEEFHKVCKEMLVFAEYIEIKCNANEMTYSCKGESVESNIQYNYDEEDLTIINKSNTIVKGNFELKNITYFSKCSSFSPNIEIFMKNDYPLILVYTIFDDSTELGKLVVKFSPIKDEAIDNKMCQYSSDEDEVEIIETKMISVQ